MSYTIRLLAPKEEAPSVAVIERALRDEGFEVTIARVPPTGTWEQLELQLPDEDPVKVRRYLREGEENPVDEEVDGFLDELLDRDETPGLTQVMDALRHARQMMVVEIPDSFPWSEERTVVDALVEHLADATGAVIQADGEGFYDSAGNLLVPME
ncbi:MAG TPA: hypothetical protein GX715_00060 [Armatimonadetes bacterium]|nr:hypothetical protein [Armatimonadota bacterium]